MYIAIYVIMSNEEFILHFLEAFLYYYFKLLHEIIIDLNNSKQK